MGELIKQGKVQFFGMSEADEISVRKAHSVTLLTAIQNEYSAMVQERENMFDLCEELGIGLVAYSPLCRGYLSGLINEKELRSTQTTISEQLCLSFSRKTLSKIGKL